MTGVKMFNILSCNNIAPPVEGRCGFFVQRKQRYCRMIPAKGNLYCAEHLNQATYTNDNAKKKKRINCPLDPKHTVFEEKLEKHLKKCNATRRTQLPYYSENINLVLKDYEETDEEKTPLHLVPPAELKELIDKVRRCYAECCCHGDDVITRRDCCTHPVLQEQLDKPDNGPAVRKHLLQQASLVNLLEESGSLKDDTAVIEFGAGRGALSHWVQKAMHEKRNTKFLLIDRQHNRNKLDCYHKGDDQGPNFERLNIDIQHLDLGQVTSLTENNLDVAAIGKHLCGGATDLSLKCLFDSSTAGTGTKSATTTILGEDSDKDREQPAKKRQVDFVTARVRGVLFALCCYHHCTWSTYVGQQFISDNGFSPLQFARITKMAGWSTCGFKRRETSKSKEEEDKKKTSADNGVVETTEASKFVEVEKEEEHGNPQTEEVNNVKLHVELGLTSDEQGEIGRQCKRLLDQGRLSYLRHHGYRCQLINYISSDITPENIALLVTRDFPT